jgi:hypothetical protein
MLSHILKPALAVLALYAYATDATPVAAAAPELQVDGACVAKLMSQPTAWGYNAAYRSCQQHAVNVQNKLGDLLEARAFNFHAAAAPVNAASASERLTAMALAQRTNPTPLTDNCDLCAASFTSLDGADLHSAALLCTQVVKCSVRERAEMHPPAVMARLRAMIHAQASPATATRFTSSCALCSASFTQIGVEIEHAAVMCANFVKCTQK